MDRLGNERRKGITEDRKSRQGTDEDMKCWEGQILVGTDEDMVKGVQLLMKTHLYSATAISGTLNPHQWLVLPGWYYFWPRVFTNMRENAAWLITSCLSLTSNKCERLQEIWSNQNTFYCLNCLMSTALHTLNMTLKSPMNYYCSPSHE